ncbi:hypothetical protein [Nocardia amikacinitolerans]|uniref:hypothetical protein n=1 Tax=Nocardia amikacinitolerans TaxID=756689 RepID=UPI0020A40E78|nr:hypothetical protein [Nocardia amikacinitolerans]
MDSELARLSDEQAERFWVALAEKPDSGHPGDGAVSVRHASAPGIYSWEVDDDMRRREFGKLAAVAGTAMMLDPWDVSGDRLGMTDVRRLLDAVDVLEREDQRAGGAQLVSIAFEQLAHAKNRLETGAFDTSTGNAFTSAVGEMAVLTGWLAFDAEIHPLARRCYSDAMALASESDNADLMAHTCLYAANQSIALSRNGKASPHHALKLVDRARDLTRGRPPGRIHALVAIRQAQALALLGDRTGFQRAITTAWRELDQAAEHEPIAECPGWLRFVNDGEVRAHEARGFGRVGEVAKAVDLLEAAVGEHNGTRNGVNDRAWLASARAAAGDLNGALTEALPVLDHLAGTVSSPRTLKVLEPVRHATAALSDGSEFRERFDALTRKATTV